MRLSFLLLVLLGLMSTATAQMRYRHAAPGIGAAAVVGIVGVKVYRSSSNAKTSAMELPIAPVATSITSFGVETSLPPPDDYQTPLGYGCSAIPFQRSITELGWILLPKVCSFNETAGNIEQSPSVGIDEEFMQNYALLDLDFFYEIGFSLHQGIQTIYGFLSMIFTQVAVRMGLGPGFLLSLITMLLFGLCGLQRAGFSPRAMLATFYLRFLLPASMCIKGLMKDLRGKVSNFLPGKQQLLQYIHISTIVVLITLIVLLVAVAIFIIVLLERTGGWLFRGTCWVGEMLLPKLFYGWQKTTNFVWSRFLEGYSDLQKARHGVSPRQDKLRVQKELQDSTKIQEQAQEIKGLNQDVQSCKKTIEAMQSQLLITQELLELFQEQQPSQPAKQQFWKQELKQAMGECKNDFSALLSNLEKRVVTIETQREEVRKEACKICHPVDQNAVSAKSHLTAPVASGQHGRGIGLPNITVNQNATNQPRVPPRERLRGLQPALTAAKPEVKEAPVKKNPSASPKGSDPSPKSSPVLAPINEKPESAPAVIEKNSSSSPEVSKQIEKQPAPAQKSTAPSVAAPVVVPEPEPVAEPAPPVVTPVEKPTAPVKINTDLQLCEIYQETCSYGPLKEQIPGMTWVSRFEKAFPGGQFTKIDVSGDGNWCGLRALFASFRRQYSWAPGFANLTMDLLVETANHLLSRGEVARGNLSESELTKIIDEAISNIEDLDMISPTVGAYADDQGPTIEEHNDDSPNLIWLYNTNNASKFTYSHWMGLGPVASAADTQGESIAITVPDAASPVANEPSQSEQLDHAPESIANMMGKYEVLPAANIEDTTETDQPSEAAIEEPVKTASILAEEGVKKKSKTVSFAVPLTSSSDANNTHQPVPVPVEQPVSVPAQQPVPQPFVPVEQPVSAPQVAPVLQFTPVQQPLPIEQIAPVSPNAPAVQNFAGSIFGSATLGASALNFNPLPQSTPVESVNFANIAEAFPDSQTADAHDEMDDVQQGPVDGAAQPMWLPPNDEEPSQEEYDWLEAEIGDSNDDASRADGVAADSAEGDSSMEWTIKTEGDAQPLTGELANSEVMTDAPAQNSSDSTQGMLFMPNKSAGTFLNQANATVANDMDMTDAQPSNTHVDVSSTIGNVPATANQQSNIFDTSVNDHEMSDAPVDFTQSPDPATADDAWQNFTGKGDKGDSSMYSSKYADKPKVSPSRSMHSSKWATAPEEKTASKPNPGIKLKFSNKSAPAPADNGSPAFKKMNSKGKSPEPSNPNPALGSASLTVSQPAAFSIDEKRVDAILQAEADCLKKEQEVANNKSALGFVPSTLQKKSPTKSPKKKSSKGSDNASQVLVPRSPPRSPEKSSKNNTPADDEGSHGLEGIDLAKGFSRIGSGSGSGVSKITGKPLPTDDELAELRRKTKVPATKQMPRQIKPLGSAWIKKKEATEEEKKAAEIDEENRILKEEILGSWEEIHGRDDDQGDNSV